MLTDLWMDLLNPANRRGHPVLAALLYVFCPAAARWWLAGADPVVPFDPLWQAHHLRSSGRTLRAVLEDWELGKLIGHARKYVEQVEAFRAQPQHRHIPAPELLPTFLGGRLPVAIRHGLSEAFEEIGGWQNFYPFVRAWAFSPRDWAGALGWREVRRMERTAIALEALWAEPVAFSAWRLSGDGRTVLGLLAPADRFAGAWIAGVAACGRSTVQREELYLLSETGRTSRAGGGFGVRANRDLIERASSAAREGPHIPVNALERPSLCRRCGYHHICWMEREDGLNPIALGNWAGSRVSNG
ncbi:MAG TPA: hypothetical protein VMN57_01435 [Anaerolineales bacterium]|nr:hypothetical protein [Anaerolineales bacterium]